MKLKLNRCLVGSRVRQVNNFVRVNHTDLRAAKFHVQQKFLTEWPDLDVVGFDADSTVRNDCICDLVEGGSIEKFLSPDVRKSLRFVDDCWESELSSKLEQVNQSYVSACLNDSVQKFDVQNELQDYLWNGCLNGSENIWESELSSKLERAKPAKQNCKLFLASDENTQHSVPFAVFKLVGLFYKKNISQNGAIINGHLWRCYKK